MIKCWASLKESALAQSVIITAVCVVFYLIGPISSYETNDDVYYSLVFAGRLVTSTPDPHVVYVNFILSDLFAKLYTYIPRIPWYGIFHVASIISSIFFLNYFYSITYKNSKFWFRLLVSLACALPFLFLIQFTKTSLVLAVTGYLGLFLLNDAPFRSRMHSLLLHAISASFLLLSFSLRKESFFLATILCSFLMLRALAKKKLILISTLSGVGILIIAFSLIHDHSYGREWQQFFDLQKTIGAIIDYDQIDYDNNQKVFSEAGWSENDYYFLKSWGYVDGKVYGKERLEHIFNKSEKTDRETRIIPALRKSVSFPAQNYILTALGLAILLLLIYRQRYKLLSINVLLPFLTCVAILLLQGRFPTRVSTAMVFFLPWAIIVQSGEFRKRCASTTVAVAALLVLAVPTYGQFKDLSEVAAYRLMQNRELHRLGTLTSGKPLTLVTLGFSFPYEGILPFESPGYLSAAHIVWLCGMNQSPLQKKQLAENGIDDIFESLLNNDNSCIEINDAFIPFLQQYYLEHYRKQVVVLPYYQGNSFVIHKIKTSS